MMICCKAADQLIRSLANGLSAFTITITAEEEDRASPKSVIRGSDPDRQIISGNAFRIYYTKKCTVPEVLLM